MLRKQTMGKPFLIPTGRSRRGPMRWVASCPIALAFLCVAAGAQTPEQVFQRASASVVVVHVSDAAGEPVGQGSGGVCSPDTVMTTSHVAQAGPQLGA